MKSMQKPTFKKCVNYNSHIMNRCHLFFETLGTKLKIDIISELNKKPMNVNDLSNKLNHERSKVSHALSSLLECNFVNVKTKGRERIYSLNKDTMVPLFKIIEKHMKKYCKICSKKTKGVD